MTNCNNNIHRAGRKPIQRPNVFYDTLLTQYQTMTTRQMASIYGVTPKTICNWLKIARRRDNNEQTTAETTA